MLQECLEQCGYLLNDLISYGNQIITFLDEKTFTVDPVVNKQNDYVVRFGKDISDMRCVSTTKNPASVMMMSGVYASNRKKMPPVWFDVGYRLTASDYKEIWL